MFRLNSLLRAYVRLDPEIPATYVLVYKGVPRLHPEYVNLSYCPASRFMAVPA